MAVRDRIHNSASATRKGNFRFLEKFLPNQYTAHPVIQGNIKAASRNLADGFGAEERGTSLPKRTPSKLQPQSLADKLKVWIWYWAESFRKL
jgi:hypothetical protein